MVERDGTGFQAGQRVVGLAGNGGYAEYAVVPAAATFPLPDGVTDTQALALLIQGLTAWHLYKTSAQLAAGESVVVHAAAGGVGSLAVQLGQPVRRRPRDRDRLGRGEARSWRSTLAPTPRSTSPARTSQRR